MTQKMKSCYRRRKTIITLKSFEKDFNMSNEVEKYDSGVNILRNTSKTKNIEEDRLKKELLNDSEVIKKKYQ